MAVHPSDIRRDRQCATISAGPGAYWHKLKLLLGAKGSEVVTFCHGLKLDALDGKQRMTDGAETYSRHAAVITARRTLGAPAMRACQRS